MSRASVKEDQVDRDGRNFCGDADEARKIFANAFGVLGIRGVRLLAWRLSTRSNGVTPDARYRRSSVAAVTV